MARQRALKPCAAPACATLVRGGTYCQRHQEEYDQRRKQALKRTHAKYNERRAESDKFYGTSRWRKLSLYYRRLHPLCVRCRELGRATPAQVVDHIKPLKTHPELATEWDNLRSLCHACHNQIGEKVGLGPGV
ncbi:MAG: HNH endonuclease [Gammaproteobacteria bacterium]|nr:HNH endonuclease [Gammaproteobacteria bacterium]